MNRLLILLGVTGLVLTACGPAPTPEEAFVKGFNEEVLNADTVDVRTTLQLGVGICTALESGVTEEDLIEIGSTKGLSKRENAAIIELAKRHLC